MRRCDALSLQMADVLDSARRQRRVTQRALAKASDLSEVTMSLALDGHTARSATYDQIAKALGCQWRVQLVPLQTTGAR